jgi:hypothetical protein
LTEGFKRLTAQFTLTPEVRAFASFVFSILAGIFVAFSADAGKVFFDGTLLESRYIASNILLGLSLGYGSKFTYYLAELIGTLRQFKTSESLTVTKTVNEPPPGEPIEQTVTVVKSQSASAPLSADEVQPPKFIAP